MCGKDVVIREHYDTKNEKEHRLEGDNPASDIIEEQMNGTCYSFDTADCAMMFKRFSSAYGSNFADE
jgi:hypothetical protein